MSLAPKLSTLLIAAGLLCGFAAPVCAQTRPVSLAVGAEVEQEIVRLTNEQRAHFGLDPLSAVAPLADVARAHSVEMIERSYFKHESPTPGQTHPWDRVFGMGIHSDLVCENIFTADGYPMAQIARECMSSWMTSPGHRANILNPRTTCVGVGAAIHRGTHGVEIMLTQDFTGPIEVAEAGTGPVSNSSLSFER